MASDDAQPPRLREMAFGEVLDSSITTYRKNFFLFIGIAALILIPYGLLSVIGGAAATPENTPSPLGIFRLFAEGGDPEQLDLFADEQSGLDPLVLGGTIVSVIATAIYLLFLGPLLIGAMAKATADTHLDKPPTIGDALGYALRRFHSILWVGIITGAIIVGGLLVVGVPAGLLIALGVSQLGGLALLLIIPLALFVLLLVVALFIRFYFAAVSVIVEGKKGFKALGRSWQLTKGSFWRVVGLLLLGWLLSYVVAFVINIPFLVVAGISGFVGGSYREFVLIAGIGSFLGDIITRPFVSILAVIVYFDLRVRNEGFDLSLLAKEIGSSPAQ